MTVQWERDTGVSLPMRETQVLSMGIIRTGSSSITEALTILGYQDVHHGITATPRDWPIINDVCDATFHSLTTYTGKPFTAADWDLLFGRCEAITDMGSFFALELIKAYPSAKVIIVERDIEKWYTSLEEAIISTTWGWRADFFTNILAPLFGGKTGLTIRKVILGFFEARDVHELRVKARDRYRRHYADIRAAVPPERLLDFKLEEGWGPLCAFLGKEIPDVPFPRRNPKDLHVKRVKAKQGMFLKMAIKVGLKKILPWLVGLSAVALGTAFVRRAGFGKEILEKFKAIIMETQKYISSAVSM
ncbi:hypothetical protein N0V93_001740 [Gnomoniopsis smithogilvyi]|uniref:Uncharacterized protein n=1 Tax=Gnomoniopsis smithogilvyi TaxID=1191159 RepID=A0A9W8Z2L7_9PEZI|nr:hypothetical protein N0V93_001740 [Gnomoniopsis smithogilvyi]